MIIRPNPEFSRVPRPKAAVGAGGLSDALPYHRFIQAVGETQSDTDATPQNGIVCQDKAGVPGYPRWRWLGWTDRSEGIARRKRSAMNLVATGCQMASGAIATYRPTS
jgi:hypothetical protein